MGHCIYRRISIAEDNKPDIPDGAAWLIIYMQDFYIMFNDRNGIKAILRKREHHIGYCRVENHKQRNPNDEFFMLGFMSENQHSGYSS